MTRPLLVVWAVALTALLAACGPSRQDASPAVVLESLREPAPLETDFPLHVEHWSERKPALLRKQENLDQVVADAADELDQFLRLMTWTRAQWPLGTPDPYPLCNGVDILTDIRAGRTGGFCGQYSYLLADALKSFGHYSVRYVELESAAGESHFAVEAWSNQWNKWVLLDPTYDAHYLDATGRPLSALELHEAWVGGRKAEVRAVEREAPKDGRRIGDLPERGLDLFERFAVSLRSDLAHLDLPLTMADRERMFLRHDDGRGAAFRHLKFALGSSRREDLYPAVAQVFHRVVKLEDRRVTLRLETRGTLPHFREYQVRIDGGEWTRSGPELEWDVPPGEHVLEYAAVNVAGVAGPVFGVRARER